MSAARKLPTVCPGMTVRDRSGRKIGVVLDIHNQQITIEKGFFFVKDFTVSFDQVISIDEYDVTLATDSRYEYERAS